MTEKPLTYLAVPYSHPDPQIRALRFAAANKAAGILMRRGEFVFSPISHTHPIAEACDLPKGWEFWQDFDRAFLAASKKVIVLCIDGWGSSAGISAELAFAHSTGIAVEFMAFSGDDDLISLDTYTFQSHRPMRGWSPL